MKRKILSENQMHLIAKATRFDNFSAQGETIKSFATVIARKPVEHPSGKQPRREVLDIDRFWMLERQSHT